MKTRSELLKLVAIVSMVIDHIGLVFFPEQNWLRAFGRIAFPIFAYQVALGYKYTSNIKKYMLRLFLFALISTIPYGLLFGWEILNVLFTFSLSLLILYIVDGLKSEFGYMLLLIPFFIPMEYGFYGLVTVLIFYFIGRSLKLFFCLSITTVFYAYMVDWWVQFFAIFGFLLIILPFKSPKMLTINKYLFYWFYPIHLLLVYLIYVYV